MRCTCLCVWSCVGIKRLSFEVQQWNKHVVTRLVKQRSGTTADGRPQKLKWLFVFFFRLEGNLVVIQFWMGPHCQTRFKITERVPLVTLVQFQPTHQLPSDFHFSGLGRCTIKSWLNRLTRIMYRKSMEICYGGCNIRTHVGECFGLWNRRESFNADWARWGR